MQPKLLSLPTSLDVLVVESSKGRQFNISIQVPDEYEQPFLHINNTARRTFSGMVMAMDEAVRQTKVIFR